MDNEQQCREAFEKYVKTQDDLFATDDGYGGFRHDLTARAFEVWKASWSAAQAQQPVDAQQERLYMDHGLLHDRATGQHLFTQDQYDEHGRDSYIAGAEDATNGILPAWTKGKIQPRAAAPVDAQQDSCVMQRACRDLPDGYNIVIELENGYGGVSLSNPDGDTFTIDQDNPDMSERIACAIDAAMQAQGERGDRSSDLTSK